MESTRQTAGDSKNHLRQNSINAIERMKMQQQKYRSACHKGRVLSASLCGRLHFPGELFSCDLQRLRKHNLSTLSVSPAESAATSIINVFEMENAAQSSGSQTFPNCHFSILFDAFTKLVRCVIHHAPRKFRKNFPKNKRYFCNFQHPYRSFNSFRHTGELRANSSGISKNDSTVNSRFVFSARSTSSSPLSPQETPARTSSVSVFTGQTLPFVPAANISSCF